MRHAERIHTDQAGDVEETLDESTVLAHLEADLSHEEDRRRIRGIANGLTFGALLWILLIIALVIAF